MELGCFSVSLTVKDIQKSKEFYMALGFSVFHGDENQGWLIMKNKNCNIGLFQGMFDKNIMTFNPGWDQDAQNLDSFTDVRDIKKHLIDKGIEIISETGEGDSGPASITISDPDGNPILLDQHR